MTTFTEFTEIYNGMYVICDRIITAYAEAGGSTEFDHYLEHNLPIPEVSVESMDLDLINKSMAEISGSYHDGCETVHFSIIIPVKWIDNFVESEVRAAAIAIRAERVVTKQVKAEKKAFEKEQSELKQLKELMAKHPNFVPK